MEFSNRMVAKFETHVFVLRQFGMDYVLVHYSSSVSVGTHKPQDEYYFNLVIEGKPESEHKVSEDLHKVEKSKTDPEHHPSCIFLDVLVLDGLIGGIAGVQGAKDESVIVVKESGHRIKTGTGEQQNYGHISGHEAKSPSAPATTHLQHEANNILELCRAHVRGTKVSCNAHRDSHFVC